MYQRTHAPKPWKPVKRPKAYHKAFEALRAKPMYECELPTESVMMGWHPETPAHEFDRMGVFPVFPGDKLRLVKALDGYAFLYDYASGYIHRITAADLETNFKKIV